MRHTVISSRAAVLLIIAGSAVTALASGNQNNSPATPVGPSTAVITQLNFYESGGSVNGFLVGTNVLLVFAKPVCGGVGTLGSIGNSVTYSGNAHTSTSGIQTVNVTGFANGTITYPPATASTKPSAYPATAGSITQLNYDPEDGSINGFVFAPISGPKVFVDIGTPGAALAPLLVAGASVSVTGTMEAPGICAPLGTISQVDASSLTIGTPATSYPVGGNR